jgi:hypothetical protein
MPGNSGTVARGRRKEFAALELGPSKMGLTVRAKQRGSLRAVGSFQLHDETCDADYE